MLVCLLVAGLVGMTRGVPLGVGTDPQGVASDPQGVASDPQGVASNPQGVTTNPQETDSEQTRRLLGSR
jgi:hypothetical protein